MHEHNDETLYDRVEVVENETGEVVHRVALTGANRLERFAERVERGMLINMNRDEYHTRLVEQGRS